MDWEGGSYMYGGVNLPRHAKSKREVSKEGMCQRDAGYARNKDEFSNFFKNLILSYLNVDLFKIILISY